MISGNASADSVAAEYGYLIHLLRCAIHEQDPQDLPEGLSFDIVFQYAMKHDVANLAFYAVDRLQKKPEPALYERWKLRRDLALARDMNQEFALQEIYTEFQSRRIPYKELQGTALKKFYPRTEYRTMSDMDFIVPKDRLEECGQILVQLGYACKRQEDFEIDGYRRPNIYVELHTDYFCEDDDLYGAMGVPSFASCTEEENISELYLYNVLHIAKHYFAGGCGIRRVLDMFYIDLNLKHRVDRNYVKTRLEQSNMSAFAEEFSALSQGWFGEKEAPKTWGTMEQFLFGAGLHGNRENFINSRLRKNHKNNGISFVAKMKYLVRTVFPGDKIMVKRYPVLEKRKILYPVFWVYRIFQMLLGRNRKDCFEDLKLVMKAKKDDP